MKKNIKSIYLLEIIMLVMVACFMPILQYTKLNKYMLKVAFSSIILILCLLRFGIKKDNHILKKYSVLIVIIHILITLIFTYFLGLFIGFSKSLFSLRINTIINGLVLTTIDVVAINLVRFIIAKNSFENKKPIIFYTMIIIVLQVMVQMINNPLITSFDIFEFICVTVIVTIARETLCSYMTYNIGLAPTLLYDLLVNIYIYVLPIVPALNSFLYSVIFVILPFSVYYALHKLLNKYETRALIVKERISKLIFWPIFLVLIFVVILVAGIFNHKMIAIASNSMKPVFSRGDAIIYEKVSAEEVNIGDVLVFERDGKIITHRVIRKYTTNDDIIFVTKGDSNNAEDSGFVHKNEVLGRGEKVVKWVGYPTVIFSEIFEKD